MSPNLPRRSSGFFFLPAPGHPARYVEEVFICSTTTSVVTVLCFCAVWHGFTATSGYAEYEIIDVSDGGTVNGQAVWTGSIPKLPPLESVCRSGYLRHARAVTGLTN